MFVFRFACLLIFCSSPGLVSMAQGDKVKRGDKSFEQQDYLSAINYYEQALGESPKDPYINLRAAQSYLLSSSKSKAIQFAYDAVKNSPKPSQEMLFTLAQANHIIHNFDSAISYYKKSDPGNTNKKLISKKLLECGFGKKYVAAPLDVKITNAGDRINTIHQEYLPYITADGMQLFFTSRRPGSVGGKKDADGRYFEDIYRSFNKGGAWDEPVNIGAPLNTAIHDACVGLSPDGQIMFVYKGSNGGDIYTSDLKGSNWHPAVSMPFNTEFFESTACLAPDGRTLFFVRKVMTGSRDIYTCSKTIGGAWSKPKKLDGINTEFDEDSPYLHPDGKTLYFSSKGHSSMGGYDIFKSSKTANGGWSAPENLGSPINTASDEVYFVLSADGRTGFYSSDKEGGFGQQDIYSIRMPAIDSPHLALLKGRVKDASTGKALEAVITITDNQSKEIVSRFNSNAQTGDYIVPLPSGRNYGIAIEKEGHLFYSENVFLSEKDEYKEIDKDISMVSAKSGAKVVLKNIFFDSGDSEIKPESASELLRLVQLLKQNPSLVIEVSGHTDNIGDAAANNRLSELRAGKVAEFLKANGIAGSRVSAKGYGSDQPIESNNSPEGRQQNRRTEFKIL